MLCVCWSRSLARAHSIYISLCNCTYTHICMSVCTLHIVPGPCVCVCVHQRALQQWVFLPTHAESSSCDLRACVFFLSLCVRTCMRARAFSFLFAPVVGAYPPQSARGVEPTMAPPPAEPTGQEAARAVRAHILGWFKSLSPRQRVQVCFSCPLNNKPQTPNPKPQTLNPKLATRALRAWDMARHATHVRSRRAMRVGPKPATAHAPGVPQVLTVHDASWVLTVCAMASRSRCAHAHTHTHTHSLTHTHAYKTHTCIYLCV